MLSVETIKPKMLSSFLEMDSARRGKITFEGKEMTVAKFVSEFYFKRWDLFFYNIFGC